MNTQNNSTRKDTRDSRVIFAMALIAIVSIIVIFVVTYLLLQVKFKEPIKITSSDWLKIILPLAGSAITVIFAFLGIDRLKNFDERQDKLAKDLRDDMNLQVENSIKLVEPRLNEAYIKWEENLQKKLSEYDSAFQKVAERINKYDKILGSVEKLEEIYETIGTIDEAHDFVAGLFLDENEDLEKLQKTRIIAMLVDRICKNEIKGDSSDYHNFSSELARNSYYEYAAEIIKKGLEIFKDNIDLLSDFIYYSHKSGRNSDVKDGIIRLEKIEKEIWTWRSFTYFIDVINDSEATIENKEKALFCVSEYKRVLPNDERAYMAEYETYKKYGELQKAESALVEAENKLAMTAQCSLALSEIYHMRGDYDNAIKSSTRAILGQAETQPSSNTGAAFAHRGLSKDAKIHKRLVDGERITDLYQDIISAIEDYEMAIACNYVYKNILLRIKLLQSLLVKEKNSLLEDCLGEG